MVDIILANPLLTSVLALMVVLLGYTTYLHFRLNRLLISKDGTNIENSIHALTALTARHEQFKKDAEGILADMEGRLRRTIRGLATVRFNPFKGGGVGGNQSFATAFVNEHGDGLIISTLYARDHVSVFGKTVEQFGSSQPLSDEETEALREAKSSLSKNRT